MANSADSSTTRCFGQRMLSPFRGVVHSVVTEWADAVTTDGRNWTLYVRGECLYDDLAELQDRAVTIPDVKYGTWSERSGFHRAPIRLPTFDQRVRKAGEFLLAAVRRHAPELPFPLADRFELWLLHRETALPLALIASSCNGETCESPALLRWTPGQACMAQLPEAQQLYSIIADLGGRAPAARWFERQRDGSGEVHGDATDGRNPLPQSLPADAFPPMLVDPDVLTDTQRRLLEAVFHWQSPSLLQLPELTPAQRSGFEIAACCHALRLAEQLPLYPCVINEAAITAAMVEARLRRSHAVGAEAGTSSDAMSPYYLEIPEN